MAVTVTVNAETAEALAKLQEFFSKGTEGFSEVTRAGEFLREMGGKIAAAFSVGAIVEFTREAINAAEQLKVLKTQTGLSIEVLSSLRERASRTREGFEGITLALTHFSQALGVAVRQGGESARGFRDLIGVDALRDFASGGSSVAVVLQQTIEAFNRLPEGATKAQLAVELFGRSGKEVLPVLQQLRGEAEKGFITPEFANSASKFNETLREVKSNLENIFVVLATKVLPKLQEFATELKKASGEGIGSSEWALNIVKVFVGAMAKGFIDVAQMLGEALIKVVNDVTSFFFQKIIAGANKVAGLFGVKPVSVGSDIEQLRKDSIAEDIEVLHLGLDEFRKWVDAAFKIAPALKTASLPSRGQLIARSGVGPTHTGKGSAAVADGGTAPLSVEAENLVRDINKAFAEAVEGKKAMLDSEEMEVLKNAKKEILDRTQLEEALTQIRATYAKKRTDIAQAEADAQREIDLARVLGQRHLLEEDPFRSEQEKKAALLASLAKENSLLRENIDLMERRIRDGTLTPEAQLAANKQLQDLQQRQSENLLQTAKTAAGGTLGGEFSKQLTSLKDEFGTVATQIAKTWKEVIGSAISSISGAISGLIEGTETWSQALRQIGTSVLNVVIQGLVNMFAAMVLGEEDVAAAKLAKQAATIPGELVGALATAISEGGWAAVAIIAAAVAALGVGVAYAAGAFAEGGRPPVGEMALVGERGPELWIPDHSGTIIPAHVTSNILSGRATTGRAAGGAGGGVDLRLYVVPDKQSIPTWARSRDFEDHVVDIAARNSHRIK